MIRRILSARSARPRVQAALKGIVEAATWMSAADGNMSEEEVEALVTSAKKVAEAAVGRAFMDELAPTPQLLDWARATRAKLSKDGAEAVLHDVVAAVDKDFKHDALVAAYRVITADGAVAPAEVRAFRQLARALECAEDETDALVQLADAGRAPPPADTAQSDLDAVQALRRSGWVDPFAALKHAGVEVHWYDAALQYPPGGREGGAHTVLRLDLDAQERTLHLHVTDEAGRGPHLLLFYDDNLEELLSFLDEVKDAVNVSTLDPVLVKLLDLCPHVFLESDGRLLEVRR